MAGDVIAPGVQRLFVGVRIRSSPAVRSLLARLGGLGNAVRPTREEQLHVTLKFLGDTADDVISPLKEGMTESLDGSAAFDWNLRGVGVFPTAARPSVVWIGADDAGPFASLAERIESAASQFGFPREGRKYHPHVTVARVKFRPPKELVELLRDSAEAEFGPQRAEEVVLFRSELGRGGSVYTPLHVVKMAAG